MKLINLYQNGSLTVVTTAKEAEQTNSRPFFRELLNCELVPCALVFVRRRVFCMKKNQVFKIVEITQKVCEKRVENNSPNATRRKQLAECNSSKTTRRMQLVENNSPNATRRKQLVENNSPNATRRKQLAECNSSKLKG